MKIQKMLTVLFLALSALTFGAPYLTINGEDVNSVSVIVGQSFTVEVASDDASSYSARIATCDAVLEEITSAAGASAYANDVVLGTYDLYAGGDGIAPGVHFIFTYTAPLAGQDHIYLRRMIGPFWETIDTVTVNIYPPDPASTAFTYQGRLLDNNIAADNSYDLRFGLYGDPNSTVPHGMVFRDDVEVTDGYFTVELDFNDASVFNGNAMWLAIGVRPGELADPNTYTALSPRQPITAAPYASHALSTKWDNITNIPSGFADDVDDIGLTAETDPVFGASAAAGIASPAITNWNAAFGWGDHSAVGYLTSYTETDPVFGASVAAGITSPDIANWNTAFGWGNHSMAGYLTSYSEIDPQVGSNTTNYVPKWNGSQLVTGSIQDNGSEVAIGGGIFSNIKLHVYTDSDNYAVYGRSGNPSAMNCGVFGYAGTSSTGNNYGVYGIASNGGTGDAWAGYFAGKGYFSGNVGIGTNSPESTLHVKGGNWDISSTEGDFKIGNSTYRLKIGVAVDGEGAGSVNMRAVGGTNRLKLGSGTEDVLTIQNSKVGIGTTNPNKMLHLSGSVPEMQFTDTGGTQPWHIGASGDNFLITETNVEIRMCVETIICVGLPHVDPE